MCPLHDVTVVLYVDLETSYMYMYVHVHVLAMFLLPSLFILLRSEASGISFRQKCVEFDFPQKCVEYHQVWEIVPSKCVVDTKQDKLKEMFDYSIHTCSFSLSQANHFFLPPLQFLSKKLRLPPTIAGITLLAIGNGE